MVDIISNNIGGARVKRSVKRTTVSEYSLFLLSIKYMSQLCSEMFQQEHDNYFEFNGVYKRKGPLYFVTITSRKKYDDITKFKDDLSELLEIYRYPSQLHGYVEMATTVKLHLHGFTHHKYGHLPKACAFHIHVKPVQGSMCRQTMIDYMSKSLSPM